MAITSVTLKLVERFLPPNLFIYFFAVAFLGSGLAMLGSALIAWLAIILAVRAQSAIDDSLLYLVYLAFGEATISGMLMTLLVVYRPSWVATFDDSRYLQR